MLAKGGGRWAGEEEPSQENQRGPGPWAEGERNGVWLDGKMLGESLRGFLGAKLELGHGSKVRGCGDRSGGG